MTMPCAWAKLFNGSDIEVKPRFSVPVDSETVACLLRKFPDFRQAYEPDGLAPDAFDDYGATVRTLRGFLAAYHALIAEVRDITLPNPDVA